MHPFVKKATGQRVDCFYLLVWLLRQRQVCPYYHLSWLALPAVAIGAHLVLMVSSEK